MLNKGGLEVIHSVVQRNIVNRTYTQWSVFAKDCFISTYIIVNMCIGRLIQTTSLTDETNRRVLEGFLVDTRKFAFLVHLLVHGLTDAAVGTISTDQDISVMGLVIGGADHDSITRFAKGEYTLVQVDFVLWDQSQKNIL
jgi:hypothetical protein